MPPGLANCSAPTEAAGRSTSILVIDRRVLTRRCLTHWLECASRQFKVTSLASAAEVTKDSRSIKGADLILFCIGAARLSSSDLGRDIRELVRLYAHVPLVVLAEHEEVDDILEAIQWGVRGYISSSLELAEAAEALRFILAGGTFAPAGALVRLAGNLHRAPQPERLPEEAVGKLTAREMEVLTRLRQGKPNKIIARELRISDSTVKVFVCRILTKLHATNRTEVAYLTQALG